MTTSAGTRPRYEMVNVQPGYVIVERERFSGAARSYFSGEPVPPKEEYTEGKQVWSFSGMAKSFQFDIRDTSTGTVTSFRELLGLLYYGCCKEESDIHRLGALAHELDISGSHGLLLIFQSLECASSSGLLSPALGQELTALMAYNACHVTHLLGRRLFSSWVHVRLPYGLAPFQRPSSLRWAASHSVALRKVGFSFTWPRSARARRAKSTSAW